MATGLSYLMEDIWELEQDLLTHDQTHKLQKI